MMENAFSGAANASPSQSKRIFTSDWDGTLSCDEFYFGLLEFLSDAARAGHRAIICSSMHMDKVKPALEIFIRSGRRRGYDIADLDQFEMICKSDLQAMKLKTDYSFDDESIAKQFYKNYVDANIEITVRKDCSTFPFTLDQLRERCGLPKRDKAASAPSSPLPSPA